jgi:hypothetical protein
VGCELWDVAGAVVVNALEIADAAEAASDSTVLATPSAAETIPLNNPPLPLVCDDVVVVVVPAHRGWIMRSTIRPAILLLMLFSARGLRAAILLTVLRFDFI